MAITLHEGQSIVYSDVFMKNEHLFYVVCCSRGWGKSYLAAVAAITAIFELLELRANVPNKTVYIIAPTYEQVVDIYFPLIKYDLGMEHYAIRDSKDLGRFYFEGGVELRLVSYEAVERLRGKGAYFVVWDEVSSCKKGLKPKAAWQDVIQPCIVTRWSRANAAKYGAKSAGRALIISTPKGYNFFYEMHCMAEMDANWKSYHYDYTQSPYLDEDDIELLKVGLDPVAWASEYLASFKESGKSVFYMFDRQVHVRADVPDFILPTEDEPGEDIHVSIDFNVGLQCSAACAIRGGQVHVIEEFKGSADTEQLAIALTTRFKGHKIYAYPDPSGRARKTSAPVGVTDFTILESYGITCSAKNKAPAIVDSVAAVNRKLYNARGGVEMYIHPRCAGTIKSLERTTWVDNNPDTATIDKSAQVEHFSDGLRYFVDYKFPIFNGQKRVARGFGF